MDKGKEWIDLKAVAYDFDSTLTDQRARVNLKAIEKIRYLDEKGIQVILNTSRDFMTALTLSASMGGCNIVAAEDGSVIGGFFDLMNGPRIIGDMNKVDAGLKVLRQALGDRVLVFHWPGRLGSYVLSLLDGFTLEEGNEILAAHGTGVRLLSSGFTFHLVDSCTDKGRGLREVINLLGILPHEVAAIGDNFNDLPMFAAAGYSIAVGNAPEAVKKQVDYVCQANYGDGFIEGVDHILSLFKPDWR